MLPSLPKRAVRRSILMGCLLGLSTAALYAEGSRFDQFIAPGNSSDYTAVAEPAGKGSPEVFRQSGRISAVAVKTDSDTWTTAGRVSHLGLSQSPVVPQTNLVIPDSLWNVQGSLGYLHQLGERRQWGSSLSVGSASDRLFHSIHEMEFQATGSYMIPSREHNAWLFLLNYSNNRAFLSNVPIPGFAYVWRKPQQGFQAVVGFPFLALSCHPPKAWSADVTIFGTTNQSVELARRLIGPVRAYLRYERNPLSWLRAGRDNDSNHLLYDEKKALIGLKSRLGHGLFLDIAGGRSFDRRFFEALDAGHTNAPEATLANAWLLTATFSARWGAP